MFVASGTRDVSRKVSVESVGDAWTDDLLRNLYTLAFRQDSVWGWITAACFLAVPGWISIVCLSDDNIVCAIVFGALAAGILALRLYFLRLPNRNRPVKSNGGNVPGKLETNVAD